jgi:hypothetical protein
MQKDERDLLDVLKFELKFLKKGGYGTSPRDPWRPQFIFEDSPTCMNYDCKEQPEPCVSCVLMGLVPPESRNERIPCRHIPLNSEGDTLDSLYPRCEFRDTQEVVCDWLKATIAQLEQQRQTHHEEPQHADLSRRPVSGIPLRHNLSPKCANPACPTAFHWLGGGKFFRFRPESEAEQTNSKALQVAANLHGVTHYWLCDRCARVLSLLYDKNLGVVVKALRPELPVGDIQNAMSGTSKPA